MVLQSHEKLYETLIAREELAKAEDMGRYYRIPADNRDLNYDKYILEGSPELNELDDYTSHNTKILSVDGVVELLKTLPYVQKKLKI